MSRDCSKRRRARTRRSWSHVWQTLVGDDGVVLVWALATVFVLTILSASAVLSVSNEVWAFAQDNQSTSALDISEAGLNSAITDIQSGSADATSASDNGTLNGGTWSYTATRTLNTGSENDYTWTITSTGVYEGTTHIVKDEIDEKVNQTTTQETVPASAAYGYGVFLGTAGSDCTTSSSNVNTLSGSTVLTTSTYVAGSLCISGGGAPMVQQPVGGTPVNLYVGGKFESTSTPDSVGTSASSLNEATIVGGCLDGNHTTTTGNGKSAVTTPDSVACSTLGDPEDNINSSGYGSGVYAKTYSSTQVPVTPPTINSTYWSANAAPGPSNICNSDPDNSSIVSTYPNGESETTFVDTLIDNPNPSTPPDLGQIVNNSGSGHAANSFNCLFYNSSGQLVGQLAFNYPASGSESSSNPGILTVDGTVWLNTSLQFSGNDYIEYQGIGTIYVNGTVTFSNGASLCAVPESGDSPCKGDFNSSQNLLEIVAVNPNNATTAWSMSGSGTYEGIAFTTGAANIGNSADVNGQVIAGTATLSGAANLSDTFTPPSGAPGAATTTTVAGSDVGTWSSIAGSWEQLQ